MKKSKPKISAFTTAAKRIFQSMEFYRDVVSKDDCTDFSHPQYASPYCCDNLPRTTEDSELDFFARNFETEAADSWAWWPTLDGEPVTRNRSNWDFESRILALLLCAEMLRDK